jgi:phage-related protein
MYTVSGILSLSVTRDRGKALYILKGEIKTPPMSEAARIETGWLLRRLQKGESLGMPHSRPMPGIGQNCHELRVNDENESWRVIYWVSRDGVTVLDVFAKRPSARRSRSWIDAHTGRSISRSV